MKTIFNNDSVEIKTNFKHLVIIRVKTDVGAMRSTLPIKKFLNMGYNAKYYGFAFYNDMIFDEENGGYQKGYQILFTDDYYKAVHELAKVMIGRP